MKYFEYIAWLRLSAHHLFRFSALFSDEPYEESRFNAEEARWDVLWLGETDCHVRRWRGRLGQRGEQAEEKRLLPGVRGLRRAAGLWAVEEVLWDRHRDDHH